MTQRVVDRLELVQVDQEQGQGVRAFWQCPGGSLVQQLLQPGDKIHAVWQPGQCVVMREVEQVPFGFAQALRLNRQIVIDGLQLAEGLLKHLSH